MLSPWWSKHFSYTRFGCCSSTNLCPGQEVSVDHFLCSTMGRLFSSRGKTKKSEMYCGGCIFVDHCSNYINIQFQKTLQSHATITSKESFKAHARDYGTVQPSQVNKSTNFSSKYSKCWCWCSSPQWLCGASYFHHSFIYRDMLIHSALHWP